MNFIKNIFSSPLIIRSGIASIDQALLSLANFMISFILIKHASKLEYGYYAIAFPIILFTTSIQGAIVHAPLAVLLVSKKGEDKKNYVGSLCFGQLFGIIPTVCLTILVIALLKFWGLDSNKTLIALAVSFSVIGLLFREFLRGYFFADENPLQVLKMDALYTTFLLSLISITYIFFNIRTFIVLFLMGICALVVALLFSNKRGWKYNQKLIKKSFRENWEFGKWALLGVMVTHAQDYSYVYLLGAVLGSEAVADVSAARFLLMPLVLAEAGWGKIVIPHGSKLREQGKIDALFKMQIITSLIFVVGIAVYVAFLTTGFKVLETYLFSTKYAGSRGYIIFWGVIFAVRFITLSASYGLQATKNFAVISKANFLTMLVTVGCAYYLIENYGIKGGLTALIIGGTLLAIALWYFFGKAVFSTLRDRTNLSMKKDLAFKLTQSVE